MKIRATPQGYLVFDRRSGLNVLIDEVIPKEHSTAPAIVSFALTNRCNLHCPHCFVAKGQSDLPFSLLAKWFVELDGNGCLEVGFGGGEPLLHPDFAAICSFVHSRTGMACTITTNGTLLSEEKIKTIRGSVDFCRISMDGWGESTNVREEYRLLLLFRQSGMSLEDFASVSIIWSTTKR